MGADSGAQGGKSAMIDNKSMADYKKEFENQRLQHRNAAGEFIETSRNFDVLPCVQGFEVYFGVVSLECISQSTAEYITSFLTWYYSVFVLKVSRIFRSCDVTQTVNLV